MSVRRLSNHLARLGQKTTIQQADIRKLREAAGRRISSAERILVDEFVREHPDLFSADTLLAIRQEFECHSTPATTLELRSEVSLRVKEPSGVATLPNGQFLVVDDEKGVCLCNQDGESQILLSSRDHKALKGLEGVCFDPETQQAYVVSEDTGEVSAISLHHDQGEWSAEAPQSMGKLPDIGNTHNKGWEGLAFLPAAFSPDGEAKLVAAHEGTPHAIAYFSLPDLDQEQLVTLPKSLRRQLSDISDVAVCPKTGHLYLLSDESSRIVEIKHQMQLAAGPGALREQHSFQVLGSTDIPMSKQRKSEGLSFDGDDTLFVVSEGDHRLMHFGVKRP